MNGGAASFTFYDQGCPGHQHSASRQDREGVGDQRAGLYGPSWEGTRHFCPHSSDQNQSHDHMQVHGGWEMQSLVGLLFASNDAAFWKASTNLVDKWLPLPQWLALTEHVLCAWYNVTAFIAVIHGCLWQLHEEGFLLPLRVCLSNEALRSDPLLQHWLSEAAVAPVFSLCWPGCWSPPWTLAGRLIIGAVLPTQQCYSVRLRVTLSPSPTCAVTQG